MRVIGKTLARALLAAALLATLAAAAYLWATSRRAGPKPAAERLVIASPGSPHTALLRIALARGYFAAEGVDVSIVPTLHGRAAVGLVVQGQADLATASDVVVALAVMKGAALRIVANMVTTNEMAVVARRDRGIAGAADLGGKSVAATFGTAGEYFLWAYLIRNRIAPEHITWVDLAPDRLVQALAGGAVDAVATWQPLAFDALAALGEARAVAFTGDGAYTEIHVLTGAADVLARHPQALRKVVRALLKAEQFVRERPDEARDLVAGELKLDAAALKRAWPGFTFEVDLQQSHLVNLEDQARWAMARGHMAPGPVPNFLPHLYMDALLEVRPARVTVVR